MRIKDRIDHIRRCLRRIKPYALCFATVEEVEQHLDALEMVVPAPRRCPICRCSYTDAMLAEMVRDALNGDI